MGPLQKLVFLLFLEGDPRKQTKPCIKSSFFLHTLKSRQMVGSIRIGCINFVSETARARTMRWPGEKLRGTWPSCEYPDKNWFTLSIWACPFFRDPPFENYENTGVPSTTRHSHVLFHQPMEGHVNLRFIGPASRGALSSTNIRPCRSLMGGGLAEFGPEGSCPFGDLSRRHPR